MTLQETTETILKWVTSCETQQQLDLLNDIVDTFVINRFAEAEKSEMIFSVVTIQTAIDTQSKLVTLNTKPKIQEPCNISPSISSLQQ